LWMTDPATGEHFTVTPGGEPVTREGDPPTEVDGYTQVPTNQLLAQLGVLSALMFGVPPDDAYQISQQQLGVASRYEPKYTHDSARDVVIDNQTGVEYKNVYGVYTSDAGEKLSPGSASWIGLENYQRLLTDPSLRSTFVLVFLWTVAFAFISVLLTFVLGMFLAIMFDVPEMPAKRLLRSLLLIPYTIPAFVAVPVWVGLRHLRLDPALVLGPLLGQGGRVDGPALARLPVHVPHRDRRAADAAQRRV
jgi:arabinogalactan oligomer/maltooligosaccharide transport system permease protein